MKKVLVVYHQVGKTKNQELEKVIKLEASGMNG